MRTTAATQLADIQKAHPDELFNLLNRVVPFLRSKNWDTRVAANKAIAGIVENADKWDPNTLDGPVKSEPKQEDQDELHDAPALKFENGSAANPEDLLTLTFSTLDITAVIKNGKKLLGSSGKEYDYSLADLDPAERLAAQKRNVTARLGLGGEYIEDEIVTEKDFATMGHSVQIPRIDTSVGGVFRPPMASPAIQTTMMATSPEGPTNMPQTPTEEGVLSKRQQNMLKRKAKANAKNHANKVRVVDLGSSARRMSMDVVPQTPSDMNTPHPLKQPDTANGTANGTIVVADYFSLDTKNPPDDTRIVVEHKGPTAPQSPIIQTSGEVFEWPFQRLCEILSLDMFDPNWEIRHGAAMGIREVVRVHGGGAGREGGKSRKENDMLNRRWLDDLACRLCCVFMLDRFGDYVSDTVRPITIVCCSVLLMFSRWSLQSARQLRKRWVHCYVISHQFRYILCTAFCIGLSCRRT